MFIGASSVPTRYCLRALGTEVCVRCGADLLLNGLKNDVEAEARCPFCERTIRFAVHGGSVKGLDPPESLLHVVEVPARPGSVGVECEGTHLFDREDCLQSWLRGYKGRKGSVLSPQVYLEHVRERLAEGVIQLDFS